MAGREPEEQVPRALVRQRWDSLTFVHWRYEASTVQRLLPPRLCVEEIDGSAWVSLIPFVARSTGLGGPATGRIVPDYCETNLRTYVRTVSGADAVWFFSLEAQSLSVVAVARALLGVPYRWASMEAHIEQGRWRYRSRRRLDRAGSFGHDLTVRPGRGLGGEDEHPLDQLLAGRWRAALRRGGGRLVAPVRHQPWALHEAELVALEQDLTDAAGLGPPPGPPMVRCSPGVDARIGAPRLG